MSDLLNMAECYYAVARDLEFRGRGLIETANNLNRYADALCEENMRRNPSAQPQGQDS